MFISNESGYLLDFNIYREVTDQRTGQVFWRKLFNNRISAISCEDS